MIRVLAWVGAAMLVVALLAAAWWGWQHVGLRALQLGMSAC
ncbi:hypothetical protein [Pseudomonas huanghezhanensis]|nr:hypothetical protein [Pseudomonas sp. BSw22131]